MPGDPAGKHSLPQIKRRDAIQHTGPISVGSNPYGATAKFTFSEIITCDWLSLDGRWHREPLVIERSGDRAFGFQTVKHVHLVAWPCAMTDYSTEDGGWAVDSWSATWQSHQDKGDTITVTLDIAVRGEGARLNRVAYLWTAYLSEQM